MPPAAILNSNQIPEAITRILQDGSTAVLATLIVAPENVGSKLLITQSATTTGSLGNDLLDHAVAHHAPKFLDSRDDTLALPVKQFAPELIEWSEAQVLFERIRPEPRLVVCGAGHVGASLVKLAALLGYPVTLIDDRVEFVSREHFHDDRLELVAAENWSDSVRAAVGDGAGVYVAIVTRGHSEDEQCLRAIVNSNADYIGLIGSKRRTKIVLERLRDSGVDEEKLERVRAPIGLDIGAVTPEEVALAILAEMVAVRRGGKGGELSKR